MQAASGKKALKAPRPILQQRLKEKWWSTTNAILLSLNKERRMEGEEEKETALPLAAPSVKECSAGLDSITRKNGKHLQT